MKDLLALNFVLTFTFFFSKRCEKEFRTERVLPELPGPEQRPDDLSWPPADPGSGSPVLLDERIALPDGLHRPGLPEPEPKHGLTAHFPGLPDEHPDGVTLVPGQLLRGTLELANVTMKRPGRTIGPIPGTRI